MMLLHREWKDVGITHSWMRGRTSGGTNLPTAKVGVTESLCCRNQNLTGDLNLGKIIYVIEIVQ